MLFPCKNLEFFFSRGGPRDNCVSREIRVFFLGGGVVYCQKREVVANHQLKVSMQNITKTCVMSSWFNRFEQYSSTSDKKNSLEIKGRRDPPRSDIFRRYSAACRGWRNASCLSQAE